MIAGKGIIHAEMPNHTPGGKDPFGLQLWIDLPKQHKLVEPSYQELKSNQIPSAFPKENVLIKVICGEAIDEKKGIVKSPVRSLGGCWFLDVTFTNAEEGESFFQLIPAGWNAFVRYVSLRLKQPSSNSRLSLSSQIYSLSGSLSLNSSPPISPFHTTILTSLPSESGLNITTLTADSRFIIVAGEPLDQEIVQYGPFVMDTKEGIQDALRDYQRGENGFERKGWKSEIGKKMMG